MAEYKLKTPHVSCLYYLYKENGTLTAKELCDICDEDKASISRSIDFLEKEEYLMCESKAEKRYKSPISLTEKGKVIAKKIANKIDSIVDFACKGNNENEREIFYKYLISIGDNLENYCNKYGEK